MANFVLNTRIPSVQGAQTLIAAPAVPNPQNNVFIFGNRRNPTSSETDGLPILVPQAGFPMYEYYNCYALPAQYLNDSLGMLSYFESCGFTVTTGYSATVELFNAAAVDITTLAANDQVIVYYLNSASLIQPMVGTGIGGTFDDTTQTVSGTLVNAFVGDVEYNSVTYDSYIILQSADFANVDAGDTIYVTFVNSNLLVPDPNGTEPFIMNLYSGVTASLIPQNINSTTAVPQIYFSFLPNTADSGLFGPISTPQTLSIPILTPNNSLTFAIPSSNVDLIPLSKLGNTTITQATSGATGIVNYSTIGDDGLTVFLTNITGVFDNTHVCSIELDPLETVFRFQQKLFATKNISLQQLALPYEVETNTDITTTYKPAFDHVALLNQPQTSQSGQAICLIAFANLSIAQNSAVLDLPSAVNNWQYEPVYYPYQPVIGELPLSAGQLASAFAVVVGSNVAPLNPQGGVIINGLPTSSNQNTYIDVSINGIADQVEKIGWNVIAVNNNQQAYIVNPITGQTTLPGLLTPDNEFYPIYVWQTIDYLRKGITSICQQIGLGQVRQTPTILSVLKGNILTFMTGMEADGMLENVVANQALITITQNPDNPLGIDIVIPAQIVPGILNIYYTINVFSSTIDLAAAA